MQKRINKIAEEFAEVFKKMKWRWVTYKFKGTPTKEMIAKHIQDDIKILEGGSNGAYTSSGRIFVMKSIGQEPEGKCTQYFICLNEKCIGEEDY